MEQGRCSPGRLAPASTVRAIKVSERELPVLCSFSLLKSLSLIHRLIHITPFSFHALISLPETTALEVASPRRVSRVG